MVLKRKTEKFQHCIDSVQLSTRLFPVKLSDCSKKIIVFVFRSIPQLFSSRTEVGQRRHRGPIPSLYLYRALKKKLVFGLRFWKFLLVPRIRSSSQIIEAKLQSRIPLDTHSRQGFLTNAINKIIFYKALAYLYHFLKLYKISLFRLSVATFIILQYDLWQVDISPILDLYKQVY